MWAPVDITAVPTAKELVDAKIAIEHVKGKLKDALLSLEQARLRVTNLETDLKARRAWIAPIRRLSFDVLSLIFEFCGKDNWRTPLRISGVSRQWRHLVLATPRAWAFLHVDECAKNTDLVDHFFKYSGNRPLHVFLLRRQPYNLLSNAVERLECLFMAGSHQIKESQFFPKLERLEIRNFTNRVAITDLGISRFPALRELICEPILTQGTVTLPTPMKVAFPPLQTLSFTMDSSTVWLGLLIACRSSLVSLKLHVFRGYPDPQPKILLPLLKCLEIHFWGDYPELWPIDMKTPSLETYIEGTEFWNPPPGTTPIHGDIGNVTRIRTFYAPNMSAMSSLRTLQLDHGAQLGELLIQLQTNRSLCPRLELIEVMQADDLAPSGGSLAEVNMERSHPFSMTCVQTWATALPYEISRSPVSNRFGIYVPPDIFFSAGEICRVAGNTFEYRETANSQSTGGGPRPYASILTSSDRDGLGSQGERSSGTGANRVIEEKCENL